MAVDEQFSARITWGVLVRRPFHGVRGCILAVGLAALGMIEEVRRQIRNNPGILNGTSAPDYRSCVRISTQASLR
jgi:Na+/H+-translocating membrane pyrophosphatase